MTYPLTYVQSLDSSLALSVPSVIFKLSHLALSGPPSPITCPNRSYERYVPTWRPKCDSHLLSSYLVALPEAITRVRPVSRSYTYQETHALFSKVLMLYLLCRNTKTTAKVYKMTVTDGFRRRKENTRCTTPEQGGFTDRQRAFALRQ